MDSSPCPMVVESLLDTDLCKITMQCAVFMYYKNLEVTYAFKNRTPGQKLSRAGFQWLEAQIQTLSSLVLSEDELLFLQENCPYLNQSYLNFFKDLHLDPRNQIRVAFKLEEGSGSMHFDDLGEITLEAYGPWSITILYEVPLLALIKENAYEKGMRLLAAGCVFAEYGMRRRRDAVTQTLVLRGLIRATEEGKRRGLLGRLYGTSNILRAMQFGIPPVGTISHEWIMGIAAISGDYENATKTALTCWLHCYGEGILGIALPDTFGLPTFLRSFQRSVTELEHLDVGLKLNNLRTENEIEEQKSFANVFTGVRHDSGCPATFLKSMREFYDRECIAANEKTMVFSDSLNIDQCLENKRLAEEAGFSLCIFGGKKSLPLNIVFKLSSVMGNSAIKISDSVGKNTGDSATIDMVKRKLGYVERDWKGTDESTRWNK
ncbi:nicotinate phosphoribosyltransferase-like protein [Mollisia scopiformis]|uniref:nicotinate phosphoribosyltransferase n=1 Tax=Mollisia scopiformis TaxID=149040 RepID=A0A194WWP1_MOLSC|nr:nicotinate phosphoribosyltransferase-like protein [Mollisia scopiformis]KUJ12396.1 nicotinate phosphoribosyltransferase-like protein [Mollisia scopiformis]